MSRVGLSLAEVTLTAGERFATAGSRTGGPMDGSAQPGQQLAEQLVVMEHGAPLPLAALAIGVTGGQAEEPLLEGNELYRGGLAGLLEVLDRGVPAVASNVESGTGWHPVPEPPPKGGVRHAEDSSCLGGRTRPATSVASHNNPRMAPPSHQATAM